uniref:Uncharacterized protein n=1 Tax=Glossina pallidipes TaxID=7398 RepID=A0A1B0A9L1_GLOPL
MLCLSENMNYDLNFSGYKLIDEERIIPKTIFREKLKSLPLAHIYTFEKSQNFDGKHEEEPNRYGSYGIRVLGRTLDTHQFCLLHFFFAFISVNVALLLKVDNDGDNGSSGGVSCSLVSKIVLTTVDLFTDKFKLNLRCLTQARDPSHQVTQQARKGTLTGRRTFPTSFKRA